MPIDSSTDRLARDAAETPGTARRGHRSVRTTGQQASRNPSSAPAIDDRCVQLTDDCLPDSRIHLQWGRQCGNKATTTPKGVVQRIPVGEVMAVPIVVMACPARASRPSAPRWRNGCSPVRRRRRLSPGRQHRQDVGGHPLDDNDRYPWLERIGQWLAHPGGQGDELFGVKRALPRPTAPARPQTEFLHLYGAGSHRPAPGQQAGPLHAGVAACSPSSTPSNRWTPTRGGLVIDVDQAVDSIVDDYVSLFGQENR